MKKLQTEQNLSFNSPIKRIIAVLLVIQMCLMIMSAGIGEGISELFLTAYAESSGTCGDNLTWTLNDDGTLTISGTGAMPDWENASSVPWNSGRESIKSVVISDGVTSIGTFAFINCTSLTNATIPDSVTSVGDCAFRETALTGVTIPANVTSIGDSAFYGTALTDVIIPDSVISIGQDVFSECTSLTGVNIGNGVVRIAECAFYGCTSLTSVTIGSGVTSIDAVAFYGCTSLTGVTIPVSVTSIGASAFADCTSLTDVYYGGTEDEWNDITVGWNNDCLNSVTIHYAYVAKGECGDNLTWTLDDDGTLTISGTGAMTDWDYGSSVPWYSSCNSIKSVVISSGVTSIGECAFYNCISLTSVTIGNNVTSIGNEAFWNCGSLESVTIPDSVTSIDYGAFENCTSLESVIIGSSVTNIGEEAFHGCTSLESATIPDGVTSIGTFAFWGCTSLTSVTLGSGVISIREYAFSGCTSLTSISVASDNENYCSVDGVLFNKDKTELICYLAGNKSTSYTIPDSVTSIGYFAFNSCTSLESVTIPDGVTNIGGEAFNGCSSLKSVTFGSGVTSIGEMAFNYCTSLASVTIPNSVTNIGNYAFSGCTSLTDVYYGGTENEWKEISISSGNDNLTGATIHYTPITAIFTEPLVSMTTALDIGSSMNLSITADNTVYIDWGDGNIVKYSDGGVTAGSDIKLYCKDDIIDFTCSGNKLTALDVSKCTELTNLVCCSNQLTELDVSKNTKLTQLSCSYNLLTSLDVSNNTALKKIWCSDNSLTKLTLGESALEHIDCSCNKLPSIDISGCASLTSLHCYNNELTEIDISKNTKLTSLACNYNCFKFSTLPLNIDEINYNSQADVEIADIPNAAAELTELASEYDINGTKTVYTWYDSDDNSVVTPTTSSNGVFTFGNSFAGKTLYCQMTNELFPDLTLTTTEITITAVPTTTTTATTTTTTTKPTTTTTTTTTTTKPTTTTTTTTTTKPTTTTTTTIVTTPDIEIDDEITGGVDVDTEVDDDFSCVDGDNNPVDINDIKLVISTVKETVKDTVLNAIEKITSWFKKAESSYTMYDISLVDKSTEKDVEVVDGKVKVTIKVPDDCVGKSFTLYHYNEDGELEKVSITLIENGTYCWFYADDFSPYVFVPMDDDDVGGSAVTPNVVSGASKLYEPWGLRYFATFDGEDSDNIADRGIVILKDDYYTTGMTAEQFIAADNAYVFAESSGKLDFETASEKYPNGRYYATLTEGIYSYDIAARYYVMPYAVMKNGDTVYGTIKKNSMENILNTNLTLTSISSEEKTICTCILSLRDSVAAHYAANGVPSASIDMNVPRGSSQKAAGKTVSTSAAGVTPNISSGASRLIEPWGLRYFAKFEGTSTANISDRGVVILNESYYSSSYATNQDAMRLNANAYVYNESNGTLLYDKSGSRWYATLTEGISSKNIADVYYVVPFVVMKDGSYVYGTVKSNSMLNIMNANLDRASVSDTEKAVTRDIIALYDAVKAYYAAR